MVTTKDSDGTTAPRVMSVPETARVMRISRSAAYQAVHRGDIPVIRVGGRLLVPTAALERLLGERP